MVRGSSYVVESPEGDRSMFSDRGWHKNNAAWRKNGPVPSRPVNGYMLRLGALPDKRQGRPRPDFAAVLCPLVLILSPRAVILLV